jgi:ADP-heptose:LPS heptosyltransferase
MRSIHIDCRQYTGAAPCRPHKQDGRSCDRCADYDPIRARVLIVKLGAAGDVLRTTALLPAIKTTHPGAHITWITDDASAAVLRGHPLVDRLLPSDACLPALLTERFDVVYGMEADSRSAALAALARCERRVGYTSNDQGRVMPVGNAGRTWWLMGVDDGIKRANRKTYQELMFEACELTGPIERPLFAVPDESRARAAAFLRDRGVGQYRALVALNTGGGRRWAQKKWTPAGYEGFLALTRARYPEVAVVLLGGPEEVELNTALLAAGIDGVFDGGCANSFADFAAVIEAADVLVTADSLALHAAHAVRTPVVVFVGPTSAHELEMYGDGTIVHARDVPCLGCYRATCDKPVTCMERLDPALVLDAVEPFLARKSVPATATARV